MELCHIGKLERAESQRQLFRDAYLLVSFAGMRGGRLEIPQTGYSSPLPSGPYICLALPGTVYEFAYGPDRDSWALALSGDGLRPGRQSGFAEMRDGRDWIPLPVLVSIPPQRAPLWQAELERMRACFQAPVPRNRLRLRLGLGNLFRAILDGSPDEDAHPSPAELLRRSLDEDLACARTLEAHSRAAGYSRDHLRELFTGAFGMPPGEYRRRRRLGAVMDLLAGSRLSVKEIAARTGFRQVSHLSAAFRKEFGMPPSEAAARYRHGG